EHDQALETLLTSEQRQRLTEIVIQNAGIFAFRDPDIVSTLGLTPEQRKAIREIERGLFRHRFGPAGAGRGLERGPPRMTKKEALAKVLEVLTADQVRKWSEIIGAPFAGSEEPSIRGPQGFGSPNERRGLPGNDRAKRPPEERLAPEIDRLKN